MFVTGEGWGKSWHNTCAFRSSHANIGREHVHVQEVGVVESTAAIGYR